jgi:hypothetical protein
MSWANMFLKNQVKMRDNILMEQKMMIDKNHIENDISYDGLKAIDKVELSGKKAKEDSLPILRNNRYQHPYSAASRQRQFDSQLSSRRNTNFSSQNHLPTLKNRPQGLFNAAKYRRILRL